MTSLPWHPHLLMFYPYKNPPNLQKSDTLERKASQRRSYYAISKRCQLYYTLRLNQKIYYIQEFQHNCRGYNIKRGPISHRLRDYSFEQAWNWGNQHHQASYHRYLPTPHSQPRIPAAEPPNSHSQNTKLKENKPLIENQTKDQPIPEDRLWKISHTITNSKSSGFYPSNSL